MEKVIVTFNNEEKEIKINLNYDNETGDIDYNVDFGEYTKDTPVDLNIFLATMFLNSLNNEEPVKE